MLALVVYLPFVPAAGKVKLGLDLKGGVHLVLRVQTDDALKLETEVDRRPPARSGDEGRHRGATVTAQPPTRFVVTGVPAAQDQRSAGWPTSTSTCTTGLGRRGGATPSS